MSGIANRIITMQFNNRQFEQNAQQTMTTLQKLKAQMSFGSVVGGTVRGLGVIEGALSRIGLRTPFSPMIRAANTGLAGIGGVLDRVGMKNPFASATQGAADVQRAAQVAGGPGGMGVLEGGVTAVSAKFIALTTIAVTALTNITNKAINSTTAWLKSFTIKPITDGLHEYETNLKAIQTVQANTDRPLPEINAALEQLNAYSDQTIYNFGEMAKNVGTFTAAGVDLETSVSSIKGIANLAALSGSSSEQAATAMYQLSQAIASGKVGLQDWNSVVNAGMGGKKLQNALAQTAIAMGDIDKAAVKMEGPMKKLTINGSSFRESIMAKPGQESWLSSDILVNTLSAMDGRFSEAALSAELTEKGVRRFSDAQVQAKISQARLNMEQKNGVKFTDEQFAALQKMSTSAFQAATKVKTLGQVFDIAKETIASGWSASFKNVFGTLDQAKALFTNMSDGLGKILKKNALVRNTMLSNWQEMGGRKQLIKGLQNAWEALTGVMGPVIKGFRDIFPRNKAKDMLALTEQFREFTKSLIPSKETMANIRDISGGVFAVFSIIGQVLSGVVVGFKSLFDTIGGGKGNFLDFGAGVGNAIKDFDVFLEKSEIIPTIFSSIGQALAIPLALLKGLGQVIGAIFNGFNPDTAAAVGDAVGDAAGKLSGLEAVGQRIVQFFQGVGKVLGKVAGVIGNALGNVGDMIAGIFSAASFDSTLDVINTSLLGAITAMIIGFFKKGVSVDLTGGLFDGIKETLGAATGALQNMQANLKANILLKIGAAIGVLALSLLILSSIEPNALKNALMAMTAGFGLLIGAMVAMMKFLGAVGVIQIYAVSSAMTKLALAMLILALAIKIFASMEVGDMVRGMVGLAATLFILTKALVPLAAGSKGMMKAAASLVVIGIALNILAVALKIFASMSWEELARGLAGLTGTLIALAIGLKLMPDMNAEAVTLIALGVAINLIAIALKIFATMSWEEMGKGMAALAASLGIISLALRSMPKGILLQAVALAVVAGAIVVLAGALKVLGNFKPGAMVKSLIMLGGAMAILAIGLNAMKMSGVLGAAALLATAAALTVLVPVLVALGAMSWDMIIKSLVALAAVFVILGLAAYVLAPLTPVILGLSASLLLIGVGLALAGAGAFAFASAFALVAAAGSAGAQVMAQVLATVISAIPPALAAFGKGVVGFAVAIGQGAPRIAQAIGRILTNILNMVIKNAPKLGQAATVMLNTMLKVLVNAIPRIADAGLRIILGFLGAIDRNIDGIISRASSIIQKFLGAMGRELPKIADAGAKMIIELLHGVAKAIRENDEEIGSAAADMGLALIEGFAGAIRGAAGTIKDALVDIAKDALRAAKDFLGIGGPSKTAEKELGRWVPLGMLEGVKKAAPELNKGMGKVGKGAVETLRTSLSGLSDELALDPNFNPTITPVLDLSSLTKEANRMSSILATSPITATASYQAASDISTEVQAAADAAAQNGGDGGSGDTYVNLEQHLHSPKPIDSVTAYRDGKSLISLAKEALK